MLDVFLWRGWEGLVIGSWATSVNGGPTHVKHFFTVLGIHVIPYHGPQKFPQGIHRSFIEKLKTRVTVGLRLQGRQSQGNFSLSSGPMTYVNAFLVLVRFTGTLEFFQRWKGHQPPNILFKNIQVVV